MAIRTRRFGAKGPWSRLAIAVTPLTGCLLGANLPPVVEAPRIALASTGDLVGGAVVARSDTPLRCVAGAVADPERDEVSLTVAWLVARVAAKAPTGTLDPRDPTRIFGEVATEWIEATVSYRVPAP